MNFLKHSSNANANEQMFPQTQPTSLSEKIVNTEHLTLNLTQFCMSPLRGKTSILVRLRFQSYYHKLQMSLKTQWQ